MARVTDHKGTHFPGRWIVEFRQGDELHTYTIPFEMMENEYYMCYVWEGDYAFSWDTAKMAVLKYREVTFINGRNQPMYQVVEGEPQPPLGSGLVLPFKQLGCQWPPHPGEDSWT